MAPIFVFYGRFRKRTGERHEVKCSTDYQAVNAAYLTAKSGEFWQSGRLFCEFSMQTEKERFLGFPGTGQTRKMGI